MNFIEIKSEALEEVQEAHEHLNERSEEISNICFDYEDQNKIPIKDEIKAEIKPEPLDKDNIDILTHSEVNEEETVYFQTEEFNFSDAMVFSNNEDPVLPIKQEIIKEPFGKDNGDVETLSYENNPMIFDEENAKKETKQTNKNELCDEVEEVLEDYVIKRPLDASNTSFGQGDTIPIKQEIKDEPLDEGNVDIETLSFENDPMIIDDGQSDPPQRIADQRKIEKKFGCDKCGKSFVSQSKLSSHFDGFHEVKGDHKSVNCGKSFSDKGNLKKHIHTVHEGHKDFKCESCCKIFSSFDETHSYNS